MSATGRHTDTHCQEHTDVPAAWERHVHRASHVAPKQPGLESSRLRCLGCPSKFNRWSVNVDDSRQSTSGSRQSSQSGANCWGHFIDHCTGNKQFIRMSTVHEWHGRVESKIVTYFKTTWTKYYFVTHDQVSYKTTQIRNSNDCRPSCLMRLEWSNCRSGGKRLLKRLWAVSSARISETYTMVTTQHYWISKLLTPAYLCYQAS